MRSRLTIRSILVPALLATLALVLATPALLAGQPEEVVMHESFEAGSGVLRIDVPDGDVVLRPNSADRVEIDVKLGARDMEAARERFDKMNFRAEQNGSEITLLGDRVRSNMDWSSGRGFWIGIEIRLPEQFDLDLRTGDGDVIVERIRGMIDLTTGDGDVIIKHGEGPAARIETGDGDIMAKSLVAPAIDVRTGDGDVQFAHVEGDEIRVRTGDGDISIERASGALTVNTGDGDVHVGLDRLGDTSIETGDGDIVIETGGAGASIELRGAEVVLDTELDFDGQRSERSAQGDLSGGGPKLRVHTGDGTVLVTAGGR